MWQRWKKILTLAFTILTACQEKPLNISYKQKSEVSDIVLINLPSSPSKTTALDIALNAQSDFFKYKVGSATSTDCSVPTTYSVDKMINTHITDNISSIPDGLVKLCVILKNADGSYQDLSSATIVTWKKDTVVTSFSAFNVTPSSPSKNPQPKISGSSEDLAVIQMYSLPSCTGLLLGDSTAAIDGSFEVTPGSNMTVSGNYNFSLLATDIAGNTLCSSTTVAYSLDLTPPSVVLTSLTSSPTKTSPITVTAMFSESVTDFIASDLIVANAAISSFSGSGTTYSWNLTPSTEGFVSVRIPADIAQDNVTNGNLASNTLTFTYDMTPPTLSITSPIASAFVKSTLVNFTGSCESSLPIVISGADVVSPTGTTCTSSTYNALVTVASGDGTKSIDISQTDPAGNTVSLTRSINLDTLAPSLTFTSTAIQNQTTKTNTVTFSGACEAGLPVVVAGGVDNTSTSCISGTWSYTTSNQASDALRSYTFTQSDSAGNETGITGTWLRDVVAPNLTFTAPTTNSSAQTGVTIVGACETGISVVISGTGVLSSITIPCSIGSYSQLVYFSASDGAKSINVTQTDLAGNVTSLNRSFIRDTAAPAITQTTQSSPYYTNTNSVSFGGACESGITINVTGADTSTTTCTGGIWSYTATPQSSDASRTYTFTQTDAAGNAGTVSATWVRDTIAPNLTFTSSSIFLTSGNSVSFYGSCESGLSITISGAATSSVSCIGGTWSYTASQSIDNTYNYTFTETDYAGNTSTLNGSWTRSTSGPIITINESSPQITKSGSLLMTGTCSGGTAGSDGVIHITGAVTTTINCPSADATIANWSYLANQSSDGTYNYTFSTTDNFSTPRTSSASITWQRDTTAPQITTSSFSINGGAATTAVSYNPVSFSATDNVSNVTKFCLKTNSNVPLASDSCWYPVNGPATNVTPANSISISNYLFNIGILPQTYQIYLWVMDKAENISTNSATSGTDLASLILSPLPPPSLSTVIVSNSDMMSGLSSERAISGGSDVYIRWTASGSSLGSNPVSLYFTTDDLTWTLITSSLENEKNNCASVTGAGSASIASTGCYKWTSGSPTSNYYKIRVAVTNSLGATTFATSLPINSPLMQIIAGNTETGLNGAATSAVFQNANESVTVTDSRNLAVSSNGTIYFRDIVNGIVYINPTDGILRQLIPLGATTSGQGDGGAASQAKLRWPSNMVIDYQNHLLVFDYDRIRQIDLNQNPPTIKTLIGGGASTANTLSNPLSLSITAHSSSFASSAQSFLRALPNGDIYFFSENYSNVNYKRIRVYKSSSQSIVSIYPTSSGVITYTGGYSISNVANCGVGEIDLAFDVTTSVIQHFGISYVRNSTANATCDSVAGAHYPTYKIDPNTYVAQEFAPFYGGTINAGDNSAAASVDAHDGNIYRLDRYYGHIKRFDVNTNTWISVLGTGVLGTCPDDTVATSCNTSPATGFVDSSGQIFFVERGMIRTILDGKVQTLYGQKLSYGDGGLATNARFGMLTSIAQKVSDGSFLAWDFLSTRMRSFNRGGNIEPISGLDSATGYPNTSIVATASQMMSRSVHFVLDSNDTIFMQQSSMFTTLTNSPSAKWASSFGPGNTTYFYDPAASGALFKTLKFTNGAIILGSNGTSLLYNAYDSPYKMGVFSEVNFSTNVNTVLAGPVDASASSTCADNTPLSSCTVTSNVFSSTVTLTNNSNAAWDSVNNKWLVLDADSKSVRTFSSTSGTMQTATTLPNRAWSMAFKTFSGIRYLYYCSFENGKLYLRNIDNSTETVLPWPISSMSCAGKNLIYDTNNHSLIFIYTQNGLYGVAELLNVDPSQNGM